MDIKASDLSARLLATENLSVIRAATRTASFDTKSRVLTLPLWKDMTPEIEDMLVGHEVGHALFTTDEYFTPIMENPKMMSYLNVLEDVRIEKMIKRKYPGLRKRMNEGYKQLNDRDFFGVKQVQDLNDLLLIDKINLYFKAGFSCGVSFDIDEKQFVNRAEKTETVDEVVALANDIYAYSKLQAEEKKKQAKANQTNEDEEHEEHEEQDAFEGFDDEDEDQDLDDMLDTESEQVSKKTSTSKTEEDKVTDEDLESKTERNFAKQLEDLADESTVYNYYKFDTNYLKSPIVGFKTILNETKESWDDDRTPSYWGGDTYEDTLKKEFEQFKTESQRTVNYLVKEFEMKKSAQLYKRAQTSKMGALDMRKVWSYKLSDDLFKRVTILPQGKNHGMLMLLDWSGSMDSVIADTLKQVINLAMFCNRTQIPYRVLAFTSQYEDNYDTMNAADREHLKTWYAEHHAKNDGTTLNNVGRFHLLELFSNKMSSVEFNSMSRRVLNRKFTWNKGYDMGGTPLNEALAWVYLNIGDYIKKNNIEKMTLITLTDGEGGPLYPMGGNYMEEKRLSYDSNNQRTYVNHKHFIRDEVTKKTYSLTRYSAPQTETILRMIKDRYQIAIVGFYICSNSRRDLHQAINSNIPTNIISKETLIENWRKDFRAQGFTSIKNTGRDEMFLIPQSSTKIEEGELVANSDMNAKAIAKNFTKYLNTKKTSRVLLNRFVALVA